MSAPEQRLVVELAAVRAASEAPGPSAPTLDVAPGDLIVPVSGGLVAEGAVLSLQVEIHPGLSLEAFKTRDQKTLEGHLNFEVRVY